MTLPANWIILSLLLTGLIAWLSAVVFLIVLLVHLTAGLVRSVLRPGRHRAGRRAPGTAAEDEFALTDHAGLNLPAHCSAEDRTTLHLIRADGSRECWICGHVTDAAAMDGDAS
ncbi:hypothetical protein [Streptomyces abikoensis]|uniref:Uncharacterized protein n=1 Tax=Streptomyces abikoensis TaxID=97398 RepID=A0ABW7TF03_9ACTN